MKKKLRKVNEILLIGIFLLTALLAAVVGLKAYDIYETNRELRKEQEEKEFAEVLARNAEAQNRVQEMESEIQEMTKDHQKLEQFITDIQSTGVFATEGLTDMVNENAGANTVSGNGSVSGNTVSSNDSLSGNFVSGNGSVSDNTVSGNDFLRDGFPVSGNAVSGNSVSGNSTVSGNLLDILSGKGGYEQPEMTLEERRQLHTSSEETLLINEKDRERIAERRIDFSGKKIACLGDSITAASNLDAEEDYQQYSYPAQLKELLGAEEVYNLGIGGSSIGRYWADAFVDRYQEIPEDVDIIIVMGGTNDGFCVSDQEFGNLEERNYRTFCGDLDELMRGLRKDYPDADIFFATPLPNILQDYLMSERDYLLPQKDFVDVILRMAQEYDFGLIDLYNSNLLDSHDANIVAEYMPDGVHGNHDGYRILAEHFAAELVKYYEEDDGYAEEESISGNSVREDADAETISGNSVREDEDEKTISGNSAEAVGEKGKISGNSTDRKVRVVN